MLSVPLWLGSALKFLGGYLSRSLTPNHGAARVLGKVAALLPA